MIAYSRYRQRTCAEGSRALLESGLRNPGKSFALKKQVRRFVSANLHLFSAVGSPVAKGVVKPERITPSGFRRRVQPLQPAPTRLSDAILAVPVDTVSSPFAISVAN
jgi:hypothetical protein